MDYADKLDFMDDDCDIEGFPIEDEGEEMNSTEKANLYNETLKKIEDLLIETDSKLGDTQSLGMLSSIVRDYDLITASNLIKMNCDPYLTKSMLEDKTYSEGNEEAGFISLKSLLESVEEIINCDDDYCIGGVKFQYFVRPETEDEMEEEGHSDFVEWYTADENIDIEKLNIQFEFE